MNPGFSITRLGRDQLDSLRANSVKQSMRTIRSPVDQLLGKALQASSIAMLLELPGRHARGTPVGDFSIDAHGARLCRRRHLPDLLQQVAVLCHKVASPVPSPRGEVNQLIPFDECFPDVGARMEDVEKRLTRCGFLPEDHLASAEILPFGPGQIVVRERLALRREKEIAVGLQHPGELGATRPIGVEPRGV